MQCQHTDTSSTGAPRVCPQIATELQIVKYVIGDTPIAQSYFWCTKHATTHASYPNGTILSPDADGMVTVA